MLASQAQEPAGPYVALWNRLDGFDASELDMALAVGAVVKVSLFRFTLHVVAASDLAWAMAAMRTRRSSVGMKTITHVVGSPACR